MRGGTEKLKLNSEARRPEFFKLLESVAAAFGPIALSSYHNTITVITKAIKTDIGFLIGPTCPGHILASRANATLFVLRSSI